MFKLKYNVIAGSIVLIQLCSLALMFFIYGLSNESDTFLFTLSIIGSIQLIEVMFIEQFMFFYHKIYKKNQVLAETFYTFSLTLAVFIGLFVFLIIFLIYNIDISYISFGLSDERLIIYNELLKIMLFGLLFYPVLAINDRLLNAKSYFGFSYLLASSMHVFLFLSLLIVFIYPSFGILFLGAGYTLGIIVGAIGSTLFIRKSFNYDIKFNFKHEEGIDFIKKSLGMRFGHNIFMVLFYPITNFFLAQLPSGFVSLFYYVYRAVIAVFSVTAGPSFKMYMAMLSQLWTRKKILAIKIYSYKYMKSASLLYSIGILLVYLILEFFIPVLIKNYELGISLHDLFIIKILYILISFWQFIVLFESVYVGILITSQEYKKFIFINTSFIILYSTITYSLIEIVNIYALGIAAVIAQLMSLSLYRKYAKNILRSV